jgi:hypothetical protein
MLEEAAERSSMLSEASLGDRLVGECVLQKRFARAETADDVRAEAAVESAAKHWRGPRSRGGLDPTKTELAMAAGRRGMARRACQSSTLSMLTAWQRARNETAVLLLLSR